MNQSNYTYRIRTDRTVDSRYFVAVQRKTALVWVDIKYYTTRRNPSDEDMDYVTTCAKELMEKLQADETI